MTIQDDNDSKLKRRKKRIRAFSLVLFSAAALLTLYLLYLMITGYQGAAVMFYISLTCTLLLSIYLFLWNLCYQKKFARFAVTLRECYLVFIAVCVAVFVVVQALIMSGSGFDGEGADVIIVLGAGIYGETPSRVLASRLDAAVDYLKAHGEAITIVSGGQGKGEAITEAEAMRRYLVRRGVSDSVIFKEEKSTSTRENIAFSLALLGDAGLSTNEMKVAVVTNEFHLYRARRVAEKLGIDAGGIPAKTPYLTTRAVYQCREAVAVVYDFFR